MASISILLTLPRTSKGLTELKDTISQAHTNDTGSASPRRKVPRLDTDSDSASASRSQTAATANFASGTSKSGPLTLHLAGGDLFNKPVSGDKEFALLRHCIRIILKPDQDVLMPTTNHSIYCACRTVVSIAKRGEGLYDVLQMELEKCVNTLVGTCTRGDKEPIDWITYFVTTCAWFETRINLLVSLLTYLDQEYVVSNSDLKPIRTTAYAAFGESIFGNPRIIESLQKGLKEWAESERNSKAPHPHRDAIPRLINQLITHGQYDKFEQYYVSLTHEYYTAESERLAIEQQKNPQVFFQHVQARISEEMERSHAVLPVGSWGLLRATTEKALWDDRLEWLATETIGPYMEAGDTNSLEVMYDLFGRVDGLKTMCAAFRKYIITSVVNIVKDIENDDDMVDRLLKLRHLANSTIDQAFSKASTSALNSMSSPRKHPDQTFVYALTDAFTIGFKARRNKPAEMIAKYLDKAMRRGQGESSDAEFDTILNNALELYRFSEDKDVFRTFYHRSLAKRLLLGKSASNDFEISMLKKMKEKYDPEFGMGEDMFKDLALSKENMEDYHSKLGDNDSGRKLNVMVLQRSAWPFRGNDTIPDEDSENKNESKIKTKGNYAKDVFLPPDAKQLNRFEAYYKGRHASRILDWNHGLGSATLKARFSTSVKELSVSLYQAVVLLLFNQSPELAFQDIKAQTMMRSDAELRRTLQSLACGKKKVLKKIPLGRDVDDDDVFRFNTEFTDPRPKVHINSIQAKVSPEESKKTNAAIEGDRKMYLDAAIVRIMKANKTMMYEKLKTATIDAVKNHFVPQVDVIKQRVDALVETEYLERDKTERNKFHYVA
ncbi:hypothetical protein D9756_000828 [Leucocoprinus leucothites]|uniref:Cullin family profile domain-containing protein n=1 Tax=Leucocoprinus leucothites TaxID=201217 RepID=A0A8H5GFG0_9AGAR|nr:hypothetical protein D9756_000828 [Leucoagaricus leucothites]